MKKNIDGESKNDILSLVKKTLVLVSCLLGIYIYSEKVGTLNFISGNSMMPYVMNKGVVYSSRDFELERYEVYIIEMPEDNSYSFNGGFIVKGNAIKRLIGFPNDIIEISHGTIIINGETIDEMYNYQTDGEQKYKLGEDEYFFVGDNRNNSVDSRMYGAIKSDNIKAKVIKVLCKGEKD